MRDHQSESKKRKHAQQKGDCAKRGKGRGGDLEGGCILSCLEGKGQTLALEVIMGLRSSHNLSIQA